MYSLLRDFRDALVSLRLTVVLIALSIVLVLGATFDQVNIGIWAVQEKWFNTFAVFWRFGDLSFAIFPGGYTLGGLLLLNLIAAHVYRFKLTASKSGSYLVHAGLILLLVGQLLASLLQDEYHLPLAQGETKNFSESYRGVELALTDTTDPSFDDVVAIPESVLVRRETAQHPKLPFRVVVKNYFPNSSLHVAAPDVDPAAFSATRDLGRQVVATALPLTYKQDERNSPTAYVELIGPEGSLGTWLTSVLLLDAQDFDYGGRTWKIALRFARHYKPYSLTLLKFSHDRYAGTEIPKNFSSRIRLNTPDGRDDREVLISMNNPLRYAGLTFYQAGFDNNDLTTILQVVRNPSWLLPYIACAVMTLGLVLQFGFHLVGFVNKRRRSATASPDRVDRVSTPRTAVTRRPRLVPILVLLFSILAVLATLRPPSSTVAFDTVTFGRLPTLVNGRLKPLDTVARTTLLVTQGRQHVATPDGLVLTPAEWLLDVLYRPTLANTYPTFEIVHPDVLALLNLSPEEGAGKKRFSLAQISKALPELDRQSKLADGVEASMRTPFQRAVIKLRDSVVLYQRLQNSLVASDSDTYLEQLADYEKIISGGLAAVTARRAGQPYDAAAAKTMLELSEGFASMEAFGYLLPIPPETEPTDPAGWKNAGASLRESIGTGRLNSAMRTYIDLGVAWRAGQTDTFNATVAAYRARLEREIPALLTRCDVEARFNAAQPFYTSSILYVVAFLLAIVSWLKWPDALGRSALWIVALAWTLATAGILVRMWLEGRPPVTNLYSSALFVGWVAVALCLLLELVYRNAIGSVAAGLIGFATLLVAHHLALSGDTLEMMRAVLDSNFWLATHVVTVTVGYSATFLAGALALIYVFRTLLTRSFDAGTADALQRMVYGIVCFATLFSFVGTVLGGIWADQSWGRFWGWDPKENGALIIVLWNALILHARWGGLVKQRGLMALAIFGNIVTAWSWFGVNMIGVGLHSYGFMDSAFWWLTAFVGSQLLAMLALAFAPARAKV